MAWHWLKQLFGRGGGAAAGRAGPHDAPEVRWVGAAENPWGVPVLDVRPVTLGTLAVSQDPRRAQNAVSFGQDDGTGFVGVEPQVTRRVAAGLRYRVAGVLADGALFLPQEMEHKWALFFHRGQVICVRSWLRRVEAVADARVAGDHLEVTEVRGVFVDEAAARGAAAIVALLDGR